MQGGGVEVDDLTTIKQQKRKPVPAGRPQRAGIGGVGEVVGGRGFEGLGMHRGKPR